jgi:asparagine synthase (glutamine-hydrolysing)
MCGIYGIVGEPHKNDERTLDEMDRRLFHRGPDESGLHRTNLGALGVRRLAIIDIEGGHQPICDESGLVWATLNGEIYNFRQVRNELERQGRHFHTDGDAEVVANAYAVWGNSFIERLHGMFAIAIHDQEHQHVLLVRDRLGKKPLYYTELRNRFIYASELKALLVLPGLQRNISHQALRHYLTFKNIPAPYSIFEAVHVLEAGHYALIKEGTMRKTSYWRPRFSGESKLSTHEAEERILALLRDAVHIRMDASDVPVGAYLSGGVDSSLVVALMAEHDSRRLKTFSLGYVDQVGHKNDLLFAREVSKRYETDHYEVEVSTNDIIRALPDVVRCLDEPFSGTISSYWLARLVSSHVKVALSGDGADEIFGSYANHRMAATVAHLQSTTSRTPHDYAWFAENRPLADLCAQESPAKWRTRFAAFADAQKDPLLTDELVMGPTSASLLARYYAEASPIDIVNSTLEVDCRTLLPDQILTYVDRLAMAFSLEVRAPFLDHRLVEFVGTLPGSLKVTRTETKRILKQAARRFLPATIVDRPKEGFILPIDAWLMGPLDHLITEAFSPSWMQHRFFKPKAIKQFLAQHRSGSHNHTYRIWTLLMFQLWYHSYIPDTASNATGCHTIMESHNR